MFEQVYKVNFELEDKYWWFVARNKIVFDLTNKLTSLKDGDFVLDFGCGTGGFAKQLSKKFKVIGIDPSPIAIEYCKKRGLELVFQSGIEDFNPEIYPIKGIFALDVIEHIEDDIGTLKRLYEILPEDGWLIVTVPAYQWLWSYHDVMHMHMRRYNKPQLQKILEKAGFKVPFISYFNFFLFIPALIKRLISRNNNSSQVEPVDFVPEIINKIFTRVFSFEGKILPLCKFPFGLSLITFAKK